MSWTVVPAALGALALVAFGVWFVATVDSLVGAWRAGGRPGRAAILPLASGARLLRSEFRPTERPDPVLWLGAPVLLVTLVMAALAVMPLAPGVIGADLDVGVVYFTAMFALTTVAAWAVGWGPNSKYPLIAGYRFVGLMLAYEMPFAITIIAVALPAESLSVAAIVAAQKDVIWNALLQPLGFAIYLICAVGVAFWGPFEQVGSADLAGGAELELSGPPLAVWRFGHYALLLATSAFAVPLFLGGDAGPVLPGWLWTLVKVAGVAGVLVATRHLVPRVRLEAFMWTAWVWLIPLALGNLFLVGLIMLLFPGFFGRPA